MGAIKMSVRADEIDNLQADRELDARISAIIMAWTRNDKVQSEIPHYSTDIVAAWTIAEIARMVIRPSLVNGWIAGMLKSVTLSGRVEIVDETYAEANTCPLAICKSALKIAQLESADS